MARSTLSGVLVLAVLGLSAGAFTASAEAEEYGDPELDLRLRGYRDHTGMFSHISLGLGYAPSKGDELGVDVEQAGIAYSYHFALGGSVMPGLAVHFSAFGFDSFGSSLDINGRRDKDINGQTTLTGFGAGVTYYLPMNLYFSGSAGLALVNVTDTLGRGVGLNPGFAARASVGYEWWVGSSWGIGAGIESAYFRASDDTNAGDIAWTGFSIAPVLSMTSN